MNKKFVFWLSILGLAATGLIYEGCARSDGSLPAISTTIVGGTN